MTNLITTAKSALSRVALFTFGILMLGLGLAFAGTIAVFAMVGVVAALLVSPFVKMAIEDELAKQPETV